MARSEKNIQGIVMIVLVVLLVLAAGYIGFSKYTSWSESKQLGTFQQGAEYGYTQAIIQIAQQTALPSCQQVELRNGNQTVSVRAVECLTQAQQE